MEKVSRLRGLLPASMVVYYRQPLLITRGEMQWLWDSNGRKYLDLFGGIVTVSVGHCHPKVNAALSAQSTKLWHTTSIYHTEPVYEYAQALTATMPEHLKVCFFTNSGSEANDLAIALARLSTQRFDILTLRNAYHGMTQTVQGATNLGNWKQPMPGGFGILKVMNPDPYAGPWGGKNCRDSPAQTRRSCNCKTGSCEAEERYLDEFETTLRHDFPRATGPAAFMAESIQGVGGTVQYPRNYLKRVFDRIHGLGGVTISDEVQTGFGRLGSHFWGFQTHQATPDIVTMAKGMGNGFPMGAVVTTEQIAKSFGNALYFNTFGGNPLAATVGKAVLDVIAEEKLQENSAVVGTYMIEQLNKLGSPLIGDVRGKGLMVGVELIGKDGKPLALQKTGDLFENLKDRGVLTGKGGIHGNVLRIKPPMCISKKDVDLFLDVLSKCLADTEASL